MLLRQVRCSPCQEVGDHVQRVVSHARNRVGALWGSRCSRLPLTRAPAAVGLTALILACGGGDSTPLTPRAPHTVDAPRIVGPTGVVAGNDACWSVDVTDETCNWHHPLGVVLVFNDATPGGSGAESRELCRQNMGSTVEVYAQSKCSEGLSSEIAHKHVNIY